MSITPFGGSLLSTVAVQILREGGASQRLLLIDPAHDLPPVLRGLAGVEVTIARSAELDAPLLHATRPDMVLVPLIAPCADIYDLAARLLALGYGGRIRAYSRQIPNVRLIEEEVRGAFPRIDFGIILLPPPGAAP